LKDTNYSDEFVMKFIHHLVFNPIFVSSKYNQTMADEKIIFSMAGVSKVYPPQKTVLKIFTCRFFTALKLALSV
jgi:hypothetical protein